ncbi:MAG: septal ring lytic transglycosylase RlpA family protein [Acidobacteriales bacterium]|nr:septal ring lytic transglycosylase RlpA family protein [Terriglobales bacterium]
MRRNLAHGLLLVLLTVASAGAAQAPIRSSEYPALNARQQAAEAPKPPASPKPYQVGKASWYGEDFDGKTTASGEPFNMYDMTAAHRELPLGTLVKVTNLHNGKVVVVRVNDRGPMIPGRIIDLSYSAASALNFRSKGVQRVRIDLIKAQSNG